ncbi:MAG: hypothetical protein IVW57_04615 [Ktedonobacterales bacterium]|nr:hypothetical protein [Ktedonobacterales bacterium]
MLLADRLRLPRGALRLERGGASRAKVVAITGLAPDDFWRRLSRTAP